MATQDYDVYMRHASVGGGAWLGFRLAWKNIGGVAVVDQPHYRWRPWVLSATDPNNPALGAFGVTRWRLDIVLADGIPGLKGAFPADAATRSAAVQRTELQGYLNVPTLELKDVDQVIYGVRAIRWEERCVEPFDDQHVNGGWLVRIELALV